MMSDGIPVTDGPLDGTGVGGVLSASPLMVPESITGDPIATDSIGEDSKLFHLTYQVYRFML